MNFLKSRNGPSETVAVKEAPKIEASVETPVEASPKATTSRAKFQTLLAAAKSGDLGLIEHEHEGKKYATVVVVQVEERGVNIVPVARIFDGFTTAIWLGSSE